MGSRGPAPIPTRLKVLRGTDRPGRRAVHEPEPRSGRPRMPADLSPAARAVWRRVVAGLGPTGLLTPADADVLAVYAEAVARYRQAARLLDQTGPLIVASGTGARRGELVKSPLHQIVRDNAVLVRLLARELGLTPSARVGMSARVADDADPFEAFLRGAEA